MYCSIKIFSKSKYNTMKKIITLLSLAFMESFGLAQNAPIDFEAGGNGAGWIWTVFENGGNAPLEIIANPVSGVGNTTATVAKFTAVDAGMDWAGCETTDIGEFTFDANNSVVKLWVYKDVISEVRVKFEGTSPDVQSLNVQNTLTGQWEELEFDFSASIGSTYNKLVIFPDFAPRDQDNVIYFDELTFNAGTAPAEPTAAAPVPTHDAADVISVYSDSYTDIANTNFNPFWGQSTVVSFQDIGGNEMMKYANFNYQGTNLGSADGTAQDLSAMEFMHLDIWTPDATVVKVTPISASSVPAELLVELNPMNQGSWNSYDIALTDFTGVSMADIFQLKFDGQAGVSPSNIFIDNIYFWKNPTAPTSAYCQTEVTHLNIAGETASAVLLTITNIDETSMYVEVESADADPVNLLLVNNGSGATISDAVEVSPGVLRRTLSWATPPENVDMQLLWSKDSFGGNWMLDTFSVPFAASCDNTGGTDDATLSNLMVDGTSVDGFAPGTDSYDVVLPFGTTTVPTVTATTNSANATHVVNDAAALPGTTTVVVTAEDGITEMTYSINFTVALENIALNKTGYASTESQPAANAFDGDMGTRWESAFEDPQWIYVDLAGVYNVEGVKLFWEGAFATEYVIEVSDDAVNWTQVFSESAGDGGTDDISFAATSARYVRMYGTVRSTIYGYSLYEFEVFGTVDPTSDATLSDLLVDGTTIDGFSPDVQNYNILLAEGTTEVPAVTATTTNPNANYQVNDASELPGITTIDVTAQDGVTSRTYTIVFTLPILSPINPAPIPTHNEFDVISIYSDTYNSLEGTNFNPGWGQSTAVSFMELEGNEMMNFANFNYQGTQLAGNQDMSAMEFVHIDVWTPDATIVKFTPISASTGEFAVELNPMNQGIWNSFDIPLSDFDNVSMIDIFQLKFDGQAGVNPSNLFIDNIYFWKNPTPPESDATLSDLQLEGETIENFSPNTLNYDVVLPYGSTDVPAVTATPTNEDAAFFLIPANSLPGTTSIIITSVDETVQLIYNVNFILEDAYPLLGAPDPVHDETANNVLSVYSDSYTNLANTNFNPNWGQMTQVVVDEVVGGNNTLKYTNLNYQGTNLGSDEGLPQDVSEHDFIHLDFWTPNATALNFVLISASTPEVAYPLTIETEEWVSVDIPLSHFSDQGLELSDIFQFKVDGGDGTVTVYFDNWYFWTVGSSSDASLSDLQVNGNTIEGFSSSVLNYEFEVAEGTNVVPTVSAVTTESEASFVVTDATEIPGTTTILVTAEDEITNLTYSVSFVHPDPLPAVAAPVPIKEEQYVVSIFSDTYTDVAGTEFNPYWQQTTDVSFLEIEGNETMKYDDFNYQGTQLASNLDLSIMEYLHIDIWTPDATSIKISPISASSGEFLLELTPLNQGSWNSYDIPLSDFTDVSMADIHQLKLDGQASTNPSLIYIDNIYFWKNEPLSGTDATLSDIKVDNVSIEGFSPSIIAYDIDLEFGTTLIPEVTATATDPNASYIISPATELPGTTSIEVTAADGETMITYLINFSVEAAAPTEGAATPVHQPTYHGVFSLYSDHYTNLEGTNFNPNWGQGTEVTIDELIGGNHTLVYRNFDFQGANLGSAEGTAQDFSEHQYFHIDIWTPNATTLNLYFVSQTRDEVAYPIAVELEEWMSLNIPLSYFANAGLDLTDIYQIKFDGGTGMETVYLDNWYFWSIAQSSDATLSDLRVDGETIAEFSPDVLSYNVVLPFGTTMIPSVAATTNDNDAEYEIIDATELPGVTEVIVTAEDEETTLTYMVQFTIENPIPMTAAPTPSQDQEDVISMFSDVYNDVDVDTWLTEWSVAALEEVNIEGNPTKKYLELDFAGVETTNNPINLESAGMAYLHIDFWTANSTALRIKLVDFGGDGYGGGNDTEAELEFIPVISEWNSLDIPLADFTGMNMNDINQFIISSNPSGQSVVYIDNVFYWKDPVGVSNANASELNIYPNPTQDFWYINSEEVVNDIQLFDLSGRLIISKQIQQNGTIQLDASDLENGFYLIKINGIINRNIKLIKE